MKFLIFFPAVLLGATCGGARAIHGGSQLDPVDEQRNGLTPAASSFTIQLGKFASGLNSEGANTDLWEANGTVLDEILPQDHNAAAGYYTGEPALNTNATFAPGDRAYVWMFNSQTVVPGSEWLLYTNDLPDGRTPGDWLLPPAPGSQQSLPPPWRTIRDGNPEYGRGNGGPPGAIDWQTGALVPEPGVAALSALTSLLLLRRKRRPSMTPAAMRKPLLTTA